METAGKAIDVGALLDLSEWSSRQKAILALTALAITSDGFDNQLAGFALPSIIKAWGVTRAAFGPVLALGLVGMSFGAIFGGHFGDRLGRRVALTASIALFGIATGLTWFATNLTQFAVLRILAGAGIGAALPNASALSAEFTPIRRRAMAVSLTIVCVPLGGMLAGLVAARVLPVFGWQTLFAIGGIAPLLFAGVLWVLLPESPRFLSRRRERWDELRELLLKMYKVPVGGGDFVDPTEQKAESVSRVQSLLGKAIRRDTLSLSAAYFFSMLAVYLVFNWFPTLLASEGLGLVATSNGLTAYNFGGVLGAILFAVVIGRIGSRGPLMGAALGGAATAVALNFIPISNQGNQSAFLAVTAAHGFFVNALQTSLFAVGAHVYPTKVRATGVAFSLGLGRFGAILSAFVGAAFVQAGRLAYLEAIGGALLVAFVALMMLRNHIPAGLNRVRKA